ncbi:hypothetical protein SAMN05428953_102144 [Mesorhizobium muleiense]|uniref:Uncharacterized protein n=1 Tax=Mesorhizobium muleiense TaxID=1004279 RepID=A0A1G8L527_9HYPH|nr:hypothetical protein SAMN05428953_102144 [Mesorhizobium muleiense]
MLAAYSLWMNRATQGESEELVTEPIVRKIRLPGSVQLTSRTRRFVWNGPDAQHQHDIAHGLSFQHAVASLSTLRYEFANAQYARQQVQAPPYPITHRSVPREQYSCCAYRRSQ